MFAASRARMLAAATTTVQQMGLQTIGGSSGTLGSGYCVGQIYTAAVSGTTIDMQMYLAGGASTSRVIPCMYSASSTTTPTTPLGLGSTYTVGISQAAGWVTIAMSGLSIVAGNKYWIGYMSDNPQGGALISYNATGANGVFGAWTSGGTFGTLPNPFPINGNHGTQALEFSLFVDFS